MRYELNPGASENDVAVLRERFPHLPNDYFSFLRQFDGGEGFVGVEPGYFQLWRANEVAQYSAEYQVHEYLPGYVAVGSNGGGELYVFPISGSPPGIFMVPAIGMALDVVLEVAPSFTDFVSEFGNECSRLKRVLSRRCASRLTIRSRATKELCHAFCKRKSHAKILWRLIRGVRSPFQGSMLWVARDPGRCLG